MAERFRHEGLAEETPANRARRVARGAELMGTPFPCVIDTDDHDTCRKYAAFPERLYILDGRRRVAYDAGKGVGMGSSQGWDFKAIRAGLDRMTDRKRARPALPLRPLMP